MLGPVRFISHWTWTIAFYVFLFLGLVLDWRQCQGRVAPGKTLSRPWWEHSACGMNMNSWSKPGCPPPRLVQRASVEEAGVWRWAVAFMCFYCLCKAERNTWVLGNKENGSEVARRLICHWKGHKLWAWWYLSYRAIRELSRVSRLQRGRQLVGRAAAQTDELSTFLWKAFHWSLAIGKERRSPKQSCSARAG